MRHCLAVEALVVALLPAAGRADDYVVLGSWNIENLGQREFGQHPAAIAQHILTAGLDILALQEIHDTDGNAVTRTNQKLDAVMTRINQDPTQDWAYALFPNRGDAPERLTGIAWNRKKVTNRGELRIPVEFASERTWNRQPHAVKFSTRSGKTDLVVIPVHMKSNADGEDIGRAARQAEAAALIPKLAAVRSHFQDDDVVVIGDMNCLEASEAALAILADAGFRDLNARDAVTYRKGQFASPFDRVFVPEQQAEFRFSLQYRLAPTDELLYQQRLSDHFLIKVAIQVLDDDDP
jgi:endonuclease/exonuclease/phosphatase family metal-dependent hydrolase